MSRSPNPAPKEGEGGIHKTDKKNEWDEKIWGKKREAKMQKLRELLKITGGKKESEGLTAPRDLEGVPENLKETMIGMFCQQDIEINEDGKKKQVKEPIAQGHLLETMIEHFFAKDLEKDRRCTVAEIQSINVSGTVQVAKDKRIGQNDHMEVALGVDRKNMGAANKMGWIVAAVNLAFLLVIVGCEMDLYGFAMAAREYWNMGQVLVTALMVICPLGYCLAAGMYLYYKWKEEKERMEADAKMVADGEGKDKGGGGDGDEDPDLRSMPKIAKQVKRETTDIQYFHFMPVFRYYVVVKEKEPDDIEAIFRINSLSSFSLGLVQIIGLLFHKFVLGDPYTIFHWINVCSQFINWTITLLYFATPMCNLMKKTIKVDALEYNDNIFVREQRERYRELTRKAALKKADTAKDSLETLRCELDRMILKLAQCDFDAEEFRKYEYEWKFDVLRRLLVKQRAGFASS